MRSKLLLMISVTFFLGLHSMAMSDQNDNSNGNTTGYGFSLDRGRWHEYAIDPDDTNYFYDSKSVLKNNNKVKVWVKFGEPVGIGKPAGSFKEATVLKEIDCNQRLIRTVEGTYFSMKDEYGRFPSSKNWENIEPETADDALLENVCPQPRKVKKK